jgi:hypothetical protein
MTHQWLLAAALGLALATLAAGCGDDGPESYVGRASNAVVHVSFTRSDDQLTGTLTQALSEAGSAKVDTDRVGLAGTVDDSAVSLELDHGLGIQTTLTGELSDDELKLDYPGADGSITTLTLEAADTDKFNAELADLRAQTEQAQAAAEQAQAAADAEQAAYANAQGLADTIASGLAALDDAVSAARAAAGSDYQSSLAVIRDQLRLVKEGTQMVLDEVGTIDNDLACSDAATVASDVQTMENDLATLDGDRATARNDAAEIRRAIRTLTDDFQALQAADPQYLPADIADQEAVDRAVADARATLRQLRSRGGSARATAEQLLAEARRYLAQAEAACERAGG